MQENQVRLIKYSEAIRMGALLGPQGFGLGYLRDHLEAICANEAASLAIGVAPYAYVGNYFQIAESDNPPCPACDGLYIRGFKRSLGGLVAHLNDIHRWTREKIADFVQQIEIKQEQETEAPKPQLSVSKENSEHLDQDAVSQDRPVYNLTGSGK